MNTTCDVSLSWVLTPKQFCDLEMLMNGAFAPLNGFLTQKDYDSVVTHMRLENSTLWPMPITLDVNPAFADQLSLGDVISLRDAEGIVLAKLTVSDIWTPNKIHEAQHVFGTSDVTHPGVNVLLNQMGSVYVGGRVECVSMPTHYDFAALRQTPAEFKKIIQEKKWKKIVAFQTRNPMHRAHQELTLLAAKEHDAKILIHPVVGMTKPGDIDYFTRIRCYSKVLATYPENHAMLSLLPLAMRMGGPREALWHAIIRKNYGCTHFIVGRDHAGPGNDKNGNPFYDPYAAQLLVAQHQAEIGIVMVPFQEMVYDTAENKYIAEDKIKNPDNIARISGTEVRKRLQNNEAIPDWFSFPEVVEELRQSFLPNHKRGFTLFFTGLSGAGKSTIAKALVQRIHEFCPHRAISLLDGDLVRQLLSSRLGFSKEDRELNVRRISYVASEITRHNGIALCALIAPYARTRQEARTMIGESGGFFEIYISTSLSVCESRDTKGLYQKAHDGLIENFTGVSDVYEMPEKADVVIDTAKCDIGTAVDKIINKLLLDGYLIK
ncbi:MAG: bifunctional sulfate adenylyltransferase/adenylylsulfate kinase [Gammaproteobacteria bacterium]|nr:bifunctional sulfate adenylyltransferase/adenylylsulfate kinase [Gammaproteobacteria bacterium]